MASFLTGQPEVGARALAALRRRVGRALFAHYFLLATMAWLFAWGVLILILRVGTSINPWWCLGGLAGIVPVLGIAGVFAWRRCPSDRVLRALLDNHNDGGGLVMASAETNVARWHAKLPSLDVPKVRQWSGRYLAFVGLGCLFVGAGMFMPEFEDLPGGSHALEIDDEANRLEEQVAILEEENIIEPDQAEALRERLDQLCQNAEGEGPVKTWEGLDHLVKQLSNEANDAAEMALQESEAMAKAESLAKSMENDFDQLNEEQLSQGMQMLADMMEQMAAETQAMEGASGEGEAGKDNKGQLDPEALKKLAEALKNGDMNPEDLQKIAEMLKNCRACNGQMMDRLCEGQLIDGNLLKLLEGLEPGDCEGLAKFLAECEGLSECDKLGLWCKRPGKGGVNRGRADAEMTWKDETKAAKAKFKEKALPPASASALNDSQVLAVSATNPNEQMIEGPDASQGGGLAGASAGAGSANTQTILPRHRGAVRRYFDQETPTATP